MEREVERHEGCSSGSPSLDAAWCGARRRAQVSTGIIMNVNIYKEAGNVLVANGQTSNGGATVTHLSAPLAVHGEYKLEIGSGARVGRTCLTYDATTNTATFTDV
jgi:hypothetical protein